MRERIGVKDGDPYVRAKLESAAKDVTDWYWQFGRPRARVTVEDMAEWAGTITYEILTGINTRVPRVYVGGP